MTGQQHMGARSQHSTRCQHIGHTLSPHHMHTSGRGAKQGPQHCSQPNAASSWQHAKSVVEQMVAPRPPPPLPPACLAPGQHIRCTQCCTVHCALCTVYCDNSMLCWGTQQVAISCQCLGDPSCPRIASGSAGHRPVGLRSSAPCPARCAPGPPDGVHCMQRQQCDTAHNASSVTGLTTPAV
jgi:hypothetical protein